MKNRFVPVASLLLLCASVSYAQTAPNASSTDKNQSIIIRKKGDAKEKTTIVIDGDKVTINGKPMEDYKDGDIQVIQNMNTDRNVPMPPLPPMPPLAPHGGSNMFVQSFNSPHNEALLGVASKSDDGGATVEMVTKNSPAEKAGLQKGDVIIKVGSTNIDNADDLMGAVGKHKPADKVSITFKRDGKEKTATAVLDKNKDQSFTWNSDDNLFRNKMMKDLIINWNDSRPVLGIRAQDLENGSGVKVLELNDDDAPAAKAGLKQDDVITGINGKTVQSIKDIRDAMKDAKPGDDIKITYQRNGASQTASVHLPKPVETSDL